MDLISQSTTVDQIVWIVVILASTVLFLCFLSYLRNLGRNLPPGPPSWPLLGSLMYLGGELHQVLWELSKKHGPIMKVGLGQHTLIVVSSAEAAEELMRKKDTVFANRAGRTIQRTAAKYLGFDNHDIAFADNTPHLRLLRKFCQTELFTSSRLVASSKVRTEEVAILLSSIEKRARTQGTIILREHFHTMSMNTICRMLFGKRYYGNDVPVTAELQNFRQVVSDVFDNVGKLNLGDLIPALRFFDLQGIEAKWKRIRPRAEKVLGLIIDEHRLNLKVAGRADDPDSRDFVDVLLSLEGNETLSDKTITALLFNMIVAGTDTTATTLEWCMVEVARHPEMARRLQQELDSVVGTERQVEESDLPQLPYLHAFAQEVCRLRTPVPITLPRLNYTATTLGGYAVPALSTIFVNIYAIAHDPRYWDDPFEFSPDRFLTKNTGLSGTDFNFLAFGSGRRKCVGIQLGWFSVCRALAAMVHAYDWSPSPQVEPLNIDISEAYSLVMRNRTPLEVVAKPRAGMSCYNS